MCKKRWSIQGQKRYTENLCGTKILLHFRVNFASKPLLYRVLRGTANHASSPQKTFLIRWYFWGVVCESSEPKNKAKYAPPTVLHSRC